MASSSSRTGVSTRNPPPSDFLEEICLAIDTAPKWATHSLRRLADTVARRYRKETEVTEAMIDIYFGWHEKVLLKAMQNYYASKSVLERMALAKITGMM